MERHCESRRVPTVRLDRFSDRARDEPAAIEDVVGVREYLAHVNEVYGRYDWYRPIPLASVRSSDITLGRWLEEYFRETWDRGFSKVAVATDVAAGIESLDPEAVERLLALIDELASIVGAPLVGDLAIDTPR
jgi:hypothetical protein